jgi:hypothetical protein
MIIITSLLVNHIIKMMVSINLSIGKFLYENSDRHSDLTDKFYNSVDLDQARVSN